MFDIKKRFLAILIAVVSVFCINSMSHAVAIIDTTGSWDGTTSLQPFGEGNTATYGQTFTVTGTETVLNTFTFFINDFIDPDFVDFEPYVYAWDGSGSRATGPALFAGSPLSTTNNGGSDGFETFTITTGGISLNSGSQYVAFFTASNQFDSVQGLSSWGVNQDVNPYAGGRLIFSNNGNQFGNLLTQVWDGIEGREEEDFAFTMTFSEEQDPIPEPATIALLGIGLAGLAGVEVRRRRKKKAVDES